VTFSKQNGVVGKTYWRFQFFGQFKAFYCDEPFPPSGWGRRRTLSLLKVFLSDPERVFTQDELIERLFYDLDPGKAVPNLQGRISELRRILEPDLERSQDSSFIETINGTNYRLAPDAPFRLDLVDAERALSRGSAYFNERKWSPAKAEYEAGIAISSLDFLPEDRYEDWAIAPADSWRERYLEALTEYTQCCARLGDLKRAIEIMEEVVNADPYRERAFRDQMLFAHLLGEQRLAISIYEKCVQLLRNELGILPSLETRVLYERIQREDPLTLDSQGHALAMNSIAVLPFSDLSNDSENEYFADGLTEDIIHKLSKIQRLKVISRTSAMRFKNSKLSLLEIGRELQVGAILEGSVRWSDGRVRIAVQLIRTDTESHLWSEIFERDLADIFQIQSEVAQRITESLKPYIMSDDISTSSQPPTGDIEAYHLYLKGRYFLNRRTENDFKRAIEFFEEALKIDAHYAQAIAGLADAHGLLAWFSYGPMEVHFPKSQEYAERALDLDGTLGEAYTALGYYYLNYEWDWAASEQSFQKSIELNPNYVPARHWYAELLAVQGRTTEAVNQLRKAIELDPLSSLVHAVLGWMNYFNRNFAEAKQNCLDAIDLDPHFNTAHWILGQVFIQQARYLDAVEALRQARSLSGDHPSILAQTAYAHIKLNEMDDAMELLNEVKQILTDEMPNPIAMATIQVALGDFGSAVCWLSKAHEKRAWYVPFFAVEPIYAHLHNQPEFQQLLDDLGLQSVQF